MKNWRDPISALTHFIGIIMAIVCGGALIYASTITSDGLTTFSMVVFTASMIALYSASTIYHAYQGPDANILKLKRIDHIMIFVYIAGTYTPVCLGPLRGPVGYAILAVVWIIAILGIVLKVFWINCPRVLSTALYVIMGWVAVFAVVPLYKAISLSGVILLLLGGITYSIGAIIYATKKPDFNFKHFGFHEIFHLFILLGSFFYILFMAIYVI